MTRSVYGWSLWSSKRSLRVCTNLTQLAKACLCSSGCTVWIEVAECHVVVVDVDQAPMRVLDDSGSHYAIAGQIKLLQSALAVEDDARCYVGAKNKAILARDVREIFLDSVAM